LKGPIVVTILPRTERSRQILNIGPAWHDVKVGSDTKERLQRLPGEDCISESTPAVRLVDMTKVAAKVALRIKVDEQDTVTSNREQPPQVGSQRRLPDATLT
jgi:hypothetical protein